MECRHEPQASYANHKHEHLLPQAQVGVIATVWHRNPFRVETFRQGTPKPPHRYAPCRQTRQGKRQRIICSRHKTAVPQYQSRRVANDSQRPAAIRGYGDSASEKHSLPAVFHHAVHHCQNHHCRCEIVKICRKHKSESRQYPQHLPAVACPHILGYKIKAPVILHYLDDCHCRQNKQDYLRCLTDIFQEHILGDELLDKTAGRLLTAGKYQVFIQVLLQDIIATVTYIQHPSQRAYKNSHRSFIYIRKPFRRDKEKTHKQYSNNNNCHKAEHICAKIHKYIRTAKRSHTNLIRLTVH